MVIYNICKLLIFVLSVLFLQANNMVVTLIIAAFVIVDYTLVPLGSLIYRTFRKRKLAPGEYRVKPKGRDL